MVQRVNFLPISREPDVFRENAAYGISFSSLWRLFIARCRATRCDECSLPVIYRSLSLSLSLSTHRSISVHHPSARCNFFPLPVCGFFPLPPRARALISFLDGAHYPADCRRIPIAAAIPNRQIYSIYLGSRSRKPRVRNLLRMLLARGQRPAVR